METMGERTLTVGRRKYERGFGRYPRVELDLEARDHDETGPVLFLIGDGFTKDGETVHLTRLGTGNGGLREIV